MAESNLKNSDLGNRLKPEEEGLNLDDILKFIEEIKKHGFKANNPKAQEILKKFPKKLQEYSIEIEKIKKDKEKENPKKAPSAAIKLLKNFLLLPALQKFRWKRLCSFMKIADLV